MKAIESVLRPRKSKIMYRQFIWNWERSPDNDDLVRYHGLSINDKRIELPFERLYEQLAQVGSIIDIRQMPEGRVGGTRFHYLFKSFDSPMDPNEIVWDRVSKSRRRDRELYERTKTSIVAYVRNLCRDSS